jgi:pimeloyl-ACP methyl ester carboxylesterase
MKKLLFAIALGLSTICFGQTSKQRTFLFVHGAWGGGWEYAKVDSLLREKGDIVFHPTLTGLGERVHLANPEINLTTHITDIVNVVKFENLNNVILVGHSYGGLVISGVAEQIPERIKQMIYLDAFVPNNGESMQTIIGSGWDNLLKSFLIKDSLIGYIFGETKPNPPTDVPQPLKTFTETIQISNPLVKKIPTAYILMTTDGKGGMEPFASRARERGWKILPFQGGHYPMRDQPEEFVKKLKMILE